MCEGGIQYHLMLTPLFLNLFDQQTLTRSILTSSRRVEAYHSLLKSLQQNAKCVTMHLEQSLLG